MVLQIMVDPVLFFHFWRHLSLLRKLQSLWWKKNDGASDSDSIINSGTRLCVNASLFRRNEWISIMHAGVQVQTVSWSKFNMKAAPFAPFSPSLPLNGSDRGMWPISGNWRSYGDRVSLPGSSIDLGDGGVGWALLHPPPPHSPWRLSADQSAKERSVLSQQLSSGVAGRRSAVKC